MIVNEEARYKHSLRKYVISFDGQFIFTDVKDWTPRSQETKESIKTSMGLLSAKTNLYMPDTLEIIANITRQQRVVLQNYIDEDRYAMLLFTNTEDQTLSFKYSQASLKQPEFFFKNIVTSEDFFTTLNFDCTAWDWA